MKRLVVTSALLASVVGLCCFELYSVNKIYNEAHDIVYKMQDDIKNNYIQDAVELGDELSKLWQNNNVLLSIFIQHESLENIEQTIELINTSIKKSEESDFWMESSRAIIQLQNLCETEFPSIGNIL